MKTEECLTDDELRFFLQDKISKAEKENFDLHLSLCEMCCHRLAEEYKSVNTEPEVVPVPHYLKEQVKQRPVGKSKGVFDWIYAFRVQFATAFGVLLIAIGGVFYFMQGDGNQLPPQIDNPLREISPLFIAPRLLSPEKDVQMTKEKAEFNWSKVAGVSRYKFFVLDIRGNIILQKDVGKETYSLPESEESVKSKETYFWYVSAQMPDGTEADSEIRKFSLR